LASEEHHPSAGGPASATRPSAIAEQRHSCHPGGSPPSIVHGPMLPLRLSARPRWWHWFDAEPVASPLRHVLVDTQTPDRVMEAAGTRALVSFGGRSAVGVGPGKQPATSTSRGESMHPLRDNVHAARPANTVRGAAVGACIRSATMFMPFAPPTPLGVQRRKRASAPRRCSCCSPCQHRSGCSGESVRPIRDATFR
jgi:hypothetical protein